MCVPVPVSSTMLDLLARAAVVSGSARRLGELLKDFVRAYERAYPVNEDVDEEVGIDEVVACPRDPLVAFYTPCEPGSRIHIDGVVFTGRFLDIEGWYVIDDAIEISQYLDRSNPIELYAGLKLLGGTEAINQLIRYLGPYERAVLYLAKSLKPVVNNPRIVAWSFRAGVLRVLHVLFDWLGVGVVRIRYPTARRVGYGLVHVVHGDDYVRYLVVYGNGRVVVNLSDGDEVTVVRGRTGRVYMGDVERFGVADELLRIAEFYHWAVVNSLALAREITDILGL